MGEKQKVLVVDDDRRMVKTICDILRVKGHDPHPAYSGGDQLLVRLAGILTAEMRKSDYVFRYGGEEFLVLLPDTELSMACDAAERLRAAVESEPGKGTSFTVVLPVENEKA